MTQGKLITALVLITIICLGLSALLLPEPGAAPAAERLLPQTPSQITSIEVEEVGAGVDVLRRDGPDEWSIVLSASAGRDATTWPADPERVRGFLRILDRLRAEPAAEGRPDAPAVLVRIGAEGGGSCELGLPASSIAGRSIVERSLDGGAKASLVTTDELSRLLARGGLRNWLDTRAFAGAVGQVVEVRVESAGAEMAISRSPAGWRIVAPFQASAEASLAEDLVGALLTLPCTPMPDLAAAHSDPAAAPTTIRLTTERRQDVGSGKVEVRSRVSTLRTIGPIGASGVVPATAHAASPGTEIANAALGPLSVEVDAERLTRTVRRPEFYLSRRVLRAAPEDIRAVVIERGADGATTWTRAGAAWQGESGPASEADARALDGLVDLLTQRDAPAAAWVGEGLPQGGQELAIIRCTGLGGTLIATVRLGVAPSPAGLEDQRMQALLVSEGVGRYYTPESTVDVVRWVAPPPPKQ